MQLAKKELEKLSRDICLAQHGIMETNPKMVPHKALPHKRECAPSVNEVSDENEMSCQEFQELWNELHKQVQTSNPTMTSNKESVKPGNSHNVQSVNNC